jgi:hypothetical protein
MNDSYTRKGAINNGSQEEMEYPGVDGLWHGGEDDTTA